MRVVRDDDVDRMQVYRWRHHSRALLIARRLSGGFPDKGSRPEGWDIRSASGAGRTVVCGSCFHTRHGAQEKGTGNTGFFILSSSFFIKKGIQVTMARRFHLFPFRTEKLSFVTPMVLRKWESR